MESTAAFGAPSWGLYKLLRTPDLGGFSMGLQIVTWLVTNCAEAGPTFGPGHSYHSNLQLRGDWRLMQDKQRLAAIEPADVPAKASNVPARRAIAGRLFVIGCPRSGTTLLQSLLAAHPEVLSFPETAVLGRLLSAQALPGECRPATVYRRTQLRYRHTMDLLRALGRRDLEPILPIRSKSIGQFVDGFVGVLDRLTLDKGKLWWVEKTLENIRFVPEIRDLVPGAKFVCLLRDGRQNVAALYDMACKYPDRW